MIGLAAAVLVSVTGSWWLLPRPVDVEEKLTPLPGTVWPPPLPPPTPDLPPADTDGDLFDTDGAAGADAGGPGLAPLLGLEGFVADTDGALRTEDGAPVRAIPPMPVGAVLPADGTVSELACAGEELLAVVSTPSGSVAQILVAGLRAERRVITLDGVAEPGLEAARARDLVRSPDGWHLLAEHPAGGTRIWRVDLESARATPVALVPQHRERLTALTADGALMGVIVDDQEAWFLRDGAWSLREGGPRGLGALNVRAPLTGVASRLGQVLYYEPRFSVPRVIEAGTEPRLVLGGVAWMQAGRVRYRPDGGEVFTLGPAATLAGPDLVSSGSTLVWARPDGLIGRSRGGIVDALVPPLDRLEALCVTGDRVLAAGQQGALRRVHSFEPGTGL